MSKRHHKAYWQGWEAAKRGKWWADNPYLYGSPLSSFWSDGYNAWCDIRSNVVDKGFHT